MKFRYLVAAAALAALAPAAAGAKTSAPPAEWDGLVKVKAKRADAAYLLPGADFRNFRKVMIDPAEVSVDQQWLKDYNRNSRSASSRIAEDDVRRLIGQVQSGFNAAFAKSFAKSGYQLVTAPGPDVLRIRPAVMNVRVNAPDTMEPGRTRTYSREAGRATLAIELRDTLTNALLGRAVDTRDIGDIGFMTSRNATTNQADFENEFRSWADALVKGLDELKANSPLNPGAGRK